MCFGRVVSGTLQACLLKDPERERANASATRFFQSTQEENPEGKMCVSMEFSSKLV